MRSGFFLFTSCPENQLIRAIIEISKVRLKDLRIQKKHLPEVIFLRLFRVGINFEILKTSLPITGTRRMLNLKSNPILSLSETRLVHQSEINHIYDQYPLKWSVHHHNSPVKHSQTWPSDFYRLPITHYEVRTNY